MRKAGIASVVLAVTLLVQSAGMPEVQTVYAGTVSEPEMTVAMDASDVDVSTSQNKGQMVSGSWTNPDLTPAEKAQVKKEVSQITDGVEATGVNTYSSVSSAAKYMRKQMVARNTLFQMTYNGNGLTREKVTTLIHDMMKKACEITDKAQEGDYLYYHMMGMSWRYAYTPTQAQIIVQVSYRTTAAQEKQVKAKLSSVISSLKLSKCSDMQKIKKIHDYLCSNTTYDYTYSRYSAYDALIGKSAVCQGYATAFYALCKQAGIKVCCVPGYAGGDHLWNLVKFGNKWYNIDTTWDSQKSGTIYTYFLKSNSDFIGHSKNLDIYKTYRYWSSSDVSEFNSSHPVWTTSYQGQVGKPTLKPVKVKSYNTVQLTWSKVNNASGYIVWYATSKRGSYQKVKTIKGGAVTNINVSGLIPGKTYYFKVQAYTDILKNAKSGNSAVVSVKTVPGKVTIDHIKTASKSITPYWKKVAGANHYQIEVTYTYKKTSYKLNRTATAGTKSMQSKKINVPKGVKCKVRIRAITKGVNGKKVYGSYSKTKTITVK